MPPPPRPQPAPSKGSGGHIDLVVDPGVVSYFLFTGTVPQLVECPLCDWEIAGSIPNRVIPKTLKIVLAALSLGAQY